MLNLSVKPHEQEGMAVDGSVTRALERTVLASRCLDGAAADVEAFVLRAGTGAEHAAREQRPKIGPGGESSCADPDHRLAAASPGRVEGGDGVVERRDVADVRP